MSKKSYNGGYELEFLVEPPDALKCPICYAVSRDPWQHGLCGRLFCRSCLDKYVKSVKQCPYCREEDPIYFMDSKSNRDILFLMVKCTNENYGCTWKGEVRKATEHLQLCEYKMINCPKKCQQKVLQIDLQNHLEEKCMNRDYECPLCEEWGIFGERTTSHLEVCPNYPTPCPNEGCSEHLPYHRIDHHALTSCDFVIIECKYKSVGCEVKVLRKDMAEHEEDGKHHLQVVLSTLADLRMRSASMELLMSSAHRQYLPKIEAKKLKSDIKQGIEKIHGKCENLQQNVVELTEKEDLNAVLLKKHEETLWQELNDIKNALRRVIISCKDLEEQLIQIRQCQENSKGCERSASQQRKEAQRDEHEAKTRQTIVDLHFRTLQVRYGLQEANQENVELRGMLQEMKQDFDEFKRKMETLSTQADLHATLTPTQRGVVVHFFYPLVKQFPLVAGVIFLTFFIVLSWLYSLLTGLF